MVRPQRTPTLKCVGLKPRAEQGSFDGVDDPLLPMRFTLTTTATADPDVTLGTAWGSVGQEQSAEDAFERFGKW